MEPPHLTNPLQKDRSQESLPPPPHHSLHHHQVHSHLVPRQDVAKQRISKFGKAEEADVKLDSTITGGAEEYINDGACAVLYSSSNGRMVTRAAQAAVMALFLIFGPLAHLLKPIKRPDPASIRKMIAEGGLREIITFLGWLSLRDRLTI
ncbi:hypothetical protein ACHAXR_003159 [Thalassiosira sp. AJA248-18]